MEGLAGIGRAGRRVQGENHSPGKGGRCAKRVSVQKIPDPAEDLSQSHRGDGDIRQAPKRDFFPFRAKEKPQNSTQEPAMDG